MKSVRRLGLMTMLAVVSLFGTAPQSNQTIGGYIKVSERRVTRTVTEYVYRATLTNGGAALASATAVATSLDAGTVIVDGVLTFGPTGANASAVSTDTFTFHQDRSRPFSFANISWDIATAPANRAPTADAGPDQSIGGVGVAVNLDGTGSSDPDGDALNYTWSFASKPAGSAAGLAGANTASPSFVADRKGTYTVQLIVDDGDLSSAVDTVDIVVGNTAPVADAGADFSRRVTQTAQLDGTGSSDDDGDALTYAWSFLSKPAGSSAVLSDASAAEPTFVVDKKGTYEIQLIVNDGSVDSAPDTVVVTTENTPPTANAGPDQTEPVGTLVTLNGGASTDIDGDSLTYAWSFVSTPPGSTATLSDPTAVNPTFTIDEPGTYEVQLVVNDGTADSAPDSVVISTENSAPVANAGPDQTVLVTQLVTLNGSASSDVDGDPLTFAWSFVSKPAASVAVLDDPASVTPTFTADASGTYELRLIVNDGTADSTPDTVVITTQNSPPVANAGPDQTVFVTDTVTLNGSGSTDVDGDPLTYAWSFTSKPAASTAALNDPSAVMPTFVADEPGTYVLQLIVHDGTVPSTIADTVTITTENSPPVADAGADQTVVAGQTVSLDGSGSSDVDHDALTYDWSITMRPSGSTAVLNDPAHVAPTFVADRPGTYVVQLIVNDGTVDSAPDTATITTTNSVPVANAGPDQLNVTVGGTVTLDGSGSNDADGHTLTYSWSLLSRPGGSTAVLSNATSVNPTFVADQGGDYVAQLIVNDGFVNSVADTVLIRTGNRPPVADAGPDQSVATGATVQLDGTGSSDPDGSPLTYAWTLTRPAGSAAVLSDAAVANPTFVADVSGTYTVSLEVSDGALNDTDDVVITAASANTLTLSPPTLLLRTFDEGTLTVAINAPAPPGGVTVNLAVTGDAVATTPASVVIAEGATSQSISVSTDDDSGTAVVTASAAGYPDDSSNVIVSLRAMSIATSNPLVGVGRSIGGTVTLANPAPAGGVTIDLDTDNPGTATASTPVTIAEGETTGAFTVNGIAAGSTTIRGNAPGFSEATRSITVTSTLISLGAGVVVAPGQSASLPVSLSNPAPPGGVTVDFVSSDTSRATVTASVFIPEGAQVPAANPQVTGVDIGSAQITATATGFAPDTATVTVTVTLSFTPTTRSLVQGTTATLTLNLSAPAPAGGLTLNLSTDNPAFATVDPTITIPVGQTSGTVTVTGVAVGSTMLRASASGVNEATATINVTPAPPITIANQTIGQDLQAPLGGSLGAPAPAGNLLVTITSDDPARLLLATSPTASGSASITVTVGAGGTSIPQFHLFALDRTGTATFRATAPGYAPDVSTVTMTPSGFIFSSPFSDFSTTTFSANTTIQVRSSRLHPTTLAWQEYQNVRGGMAPVEVEFTSGTPAVGVITVSPIAFGPNVGVMNTAFDPLSGGSTELAVVTPAGWDQSADFREMTATVTAPNISIPATLNRGQDLQDSMSIALPVTPPSARDITVTVADSSIATITTDPLVAGTGTVVFSGVTNTSGRTLYVQGRGMGTTTLTVSAPGYNSDTSTINVHPSGFIFSSPFSDFATTTFAANTTIQVRSSRLHPTTLAWQEYQNVRGGMTPVSVAFTSATPAVGIITVSPINFGPNVGVMNTAFDPLTAGSTELAVVTPAGWDQSADFREMTATVNTPNINVGDVTVGRDLQRAVTITLPVAPPGPVNVTVTVASGAIATITTDGTVAGGTTHTFMGVTGTSVGTIFVQGRSLGTTTMTVQASGYNDGVSDVRVDPSGFIFSSPFQNFSTTVGAANTTITVRPSRLNPTTLNWAEYQNLRGGLNVDVDVTSSNVATGVITISPIAFGPNAASGTTAFDPLAVGSSTLSVLVPGGFHQPSDFRQMVVTVNP